MTGKTWIWTGVALIAMFLLGAMAGRFYDSKQETKWLAQVQAAKDDAKAASLQAETYLELANEARDKAAEIRVKVVEGETKIVRIPADLKTLDTCRAAVRDLKYNRLLLKEELKASNAEALALRDALKFKMTESDRLAEALKVEDKRYTALTRSRKKEKRRRIAVLVVSHAAVFGAGYGIGTIR